MKTANSYLCLFFKDCTGIRSLFFFIFLIFSNTYFQQTILSSENSNVFEIKTRKFWFKEIPRFSFWLEINLTKYGKQKTGWLEKKRNVILKIYRKRKEKVISENLVQILKSLLGIWHTKGKKGNIWKRWIAFNTTTPLYFTKIQ